MAGIERFAVVDTETTGVFNNDRVLEVAIVTLSADGAVVDEWDTLINPQRDIGPSWIHGVTATMLQDAPTFDEVLGDLAARLHGAVLVAHNLPFDVRMLRNELARTNLDVDFGVGLDTLRGSRARLAAACRAYGIRHEAAHTALHDARATAQLLLRCAEQCLAHPPAPVTIPPGATLPGGRRLQRTTSMQASRPYLARLTEQLSHPDAQAASAAYLDLLDRCMANLHLDADERQQLTELAEELGLSAQQRAAAHRMWLHDLIDAALADEVVTAEEYDQLCRAAVVLDCEQTVVDRRTQPLRTRTQPVALAPGTTVCFTGEPFDPDTGEKVARSQLREHAYRLGLEPVANVTQSNCDLLVAADPASASGKAHKANRYGVPIVDAFAFLAAQAGATVASARLYVSPLEALLCPTCTRAWTRKPGSRRQAHCDGCRQEAHVRHGGKRLSNERPTPDRRQARPPAGDATPPRDDQFEPPLETLECVACGDRWQRPRTRGRKPRWCPACR
jgi:DNA polymerase III subunit epsilon